MSSKVIQPAARRAKESSPESTVNNFAAVTDQNSFSNPLRPERVSPGRIAPHRTRSISAQPKRLMERIPVGAAARPQTSERTEPCEGPDTSTTRGQPTMPRKAHHMKSYSELTHFAGLDWAKDHHDAHIMDRQGQVVAQFRFSHTG